jgi:hypothetical protein
LEEGGQAFGTPSASLDGYVCVVRCPRYCMCFYSLELCLYSNSRCISRLFRAQMSSQQMREAAHAQTPRATSKGGGRRQVPTGSPDRSPECVLVRHGTTRVYCSSSTNSVFLLASIHSSHLLIPHRFNRTRAARRTYICRKNPIVQVRSLTHS